MVTAGKARKKRTSVSVKSKDRLNVYSNKKSSKKITKEQNNICSEFTTTNTNDRFFCWTTKYSPVIITLGMGLLTYFFIVLTIFYPDQFAGASWFKLIIAIVFLFLIGGLMLYLSLRTELIFIRTTSFVFVFILFTFLLLFILLSHSMPQV